MLTPLGGAMIVGGLYWLILTVARRITSDDQYRASEERQAAIGRSPLGGGLSAAPERISRLAYEHPVLVRLPAQICIGVGVVLILVDIFS